MHALAANPSSTTAGIITSCATVITAVSVLIAALTIFLPVLKGLKRTEARVEDVQAQVNTVHTIVNQQRTDAQRYNIALTELLRKNDIEIPIDQSLPVTGQPDASPGQPSDVTR